MAKDDSGTLAQEFLRSAEDLQSKLGAVGTAESMGMEREARELVETFKAWQTKRPADATRIAAIRHLMDLNRRAMQYLAERPGRSRKSWP
jgi:hypothetical protein